MLEMYHEAEIEKSIVAAIASDKDQDLKNILESSCLDITHFRDE
jgi:hypothetical protein